MGMGSNMKNNLKILLEYLMEDNDNDSVTLYHGTLKENVLSILSGGLKVSSGWGGAGTEGVYLSKTPSGAEYWAKIAYMSKNEEPLEPEKFNRKYGDKKEDLISILRIVIPASETKNLKADMEQAEEYGFEGESEDWQQSLDVIGDVMHDGDIPSAWITVLQ